MLQRILHKLPLKQKFNLLEIHFLDAERVQFYGLIIEKAKDEFSVEKHFEATSMDAVVKEINTKDPILLHFSGTGILHKETERVSKYRNKVLFKANPEDFYFYELHQANTIFLSFCRKKLIDTYLAIFAEKQYHVVDFAIGPFVNTVTASFANLKSIQTLETQLNFTTKEQLLNFRSEKLSEKVHYNIDDLHISAQEISVFSTFLQYQVQDERVQLEAPFLESNREEFNFYTATKIVGIIGLGIILLSILIGHFTLSSYQEKFAENEANMIQANDDATTISQLKKEKKNKEEILSISGLFHPKFLTQYFYDIGNSLQPEIKLTEINIIPIAKKIKREEEIQFNYNQIHLKGITSNDSYFNDWFEDISGRDWVKKIEIEEYIQGRSTQKTFLIHVYF